MSGVLGPFALQQQYDPFTPLQKMANIGQTNTAITAGQLANQLTGLQLGYRENLLGSMGIGPMASQNGGAAPSNGMASLAAGAPPIGGQGGNGSAPSSGGAPPNGQQAPQLPGDIAAARVGIAMPPSVYAGIAFSPDPASALSDITKSRQQILYSAAQSAATPDQWDQNVVQLASQGWISSTQAQQLYGNYGLRARIVQAQASPDENLKYTGEMSGQGLQVDDNGNPIVSPAAVAATGAKSQASAYGNAAGQLPLAEQLAAAKSGGAAAGALPYAGATAAATAAGGDQGHLAYGPQLTAADANAKVPATQASPYTLAPGDTRINPPVPSATAGATTGADLVNPTQAIPAAAYAARITGAENATGNPGAANASGPGGTPTSSAVGNGQFISGTWLQMMQQYRPDLTQGKTDAQILALRSNPQLSQQMTIAYAQENSSALANAGLPVNSATLGMSHRLGGENAAIVLKSPPNAPLSTILPPLVMAANPDLANQTVQTFINGSIAKYGVVPVQLGAPPAASPSAAPAAPPPAAAPTNLNVIPAGITPGPGQTNAPPAAAPPLAIDVSGATPAAPPATPAPSLAPPASTAAASPAAPSVVPIPGGGSAVTSPITPQIKAEQDAIGDAYGDQAKQIMQAGAQAPTVLGKLDILQNAADAFRTGATGEDRLAAWKTLTDAFQSVGVTPPSWMSTAAAAGETIQKVGGGLAADMTRAMGSREAASVFNSIKSIMPNVTMSQGGFGIVLNVLKEGALRDQDLSNFQDQWLSTHSSIAGMRPAFEQTHPIEAYASRVIPFSAPSDPTQAKVGAIYKNSSGQLGMWDGQQFQIVSGGQ